MKNFQLFFILAIFISCNKTYNKEERLLIEVLKTNIQLLENENKISYDYFDEKIKKLDFYKQKLLAEKFCKIDSLIRLSKNISFANFSYKNIDSLFTIFDNINLKGKNKFQFKKLKFDEIKLDSIRFLTFKVNFLNLILEYQNSIFMELDANALHCWTTEYRPFFLNPNNIFNSSSSDSFYILTAKPYNFKLLNHIRLMKSDKIISEDTLFGDYYKFKKLNKGEYTIECKGYRYCFLNDSMINEDAYFSSNVFHFKVE